MSRRVKQRAAVGRLGKHLTRRSRGRCELCAGRDAPVPFELAPFPPEPDPDRTLMACLRCRAWLERERIEPIEARFLAVAVWSELPSVRLAAARLLLTIDDPDDPWMQEALDVADVDPVTREPRVHPGDPHPIGEH